MKNILLMVVVAAGLGLSACGNSNNSTPNNNVATTPQACGTQIPSQYCTSYNPTGYSYGNLSYGNYGYGYYGSSGFAGYGCPMGYQPLSLGSYYAGTSSYTCVVTNYFSGYNSGYTPYYAYGQRWANNHVGHGAAQACSVGSNTCSVGRCLAFSGSNMGYCAR